MLGRFVNGPLAVMADPSASFAVTNRDNNGDGLSIPVRVGYQVSGQLNVGGITGIFGRIRRIRRQLRHPAGRQRLVRARRPDRPRRQLQLHESGGAGRQRRRPRAGAVCEPTPLTATATATATGCVLARRHDRDGQVAKAEEQVQPVDPGGLAARGAEDPERGEAETQDRGRGRNGRVLSGSSISAPMANETMAATASNQRIVALRSS